MIRSFVVDLCAKNLLVMTDAWLNQSLAHVDQGNFYFFPYGHAASWARTRLFGTEAEDVKKAILAELRSRKEKKEFSKPPKNVTKTILRDMRRDDPVSHYERNIKLKRRS